MNDHCEHSKFLKINRTPVFYIHQYSSKMYWMKSELIEYGRAVLGCNEKGILQPFRKSQSHIQLVS